MNTHNKLRILLLLLEFPTWYRASHLSYGAQLGLAAGLRANGVKHLTITTPWFLRAQEICAGKKFDQVWIEIVHNDVDEAFLQWVATLAPVRIGLIGESLEYHPEEYATCSELEGRKEKVERRLKYVTHVLACDEKDVDDLNARKLVPALWWPQAVPARCICEREETVQRKCGVFSGSFYGERANWLEYPELKGLLVHQPSPEHATVYPVLFGKLHGAVRRFMRSGFPINNGILSLYLNCLLYIRRQCFALWLEGMRMGCAVVNLPHFVKAYPGRVVEAVAAGRPVISWEIPDRPQNRALFEDDKEILVYPGNDPMQLAAQIEHIVSDPDLAKRITTNARRKLRRFHTIERRIRQILDWVATGDTPIYF